MIVLYTDYGVSGPYVGLLHGVLQRAAPQIPRIDLMHDVPGFAIQPAAYLLAALAQEFESGAVFLAVVDPGVGGKRRGAIVQADGQWFVGPDNGLFNVVAQRAKQLHWFDSSYDPEHLSNSFHGRDIFAPVAARIACGDAIPGTQVDPVNRLDSTWKKNLAQVIYVDGFGNLMTGIQAGTLTSKSCVTIANRQITHARTFCEVPIGHAFWYENSIGLVEIAMNQGNASASLSVNVGADLSVADPP